MSINTLRRAAWRLCCKLAVVALILQPAPSMRAQAPAAQAAAEPLAAVQVVEPGAPAGPASPGAPQLPAPINVLPEDARLIHIPDSAQGQLGSVPAPWAAAAPPLVPGSVPFGLHLGVTSTHVPAVPGDTLTYTLVISNDQDLPLVGAELALGLSGAARWRGGPGLPPPLPHGGGLISATLPAIAPHQARTFLFQEALWGVHDGDTLPQHVAVALRAQGLLTETEALVPLEHVESHGSAGPQGGALNDARLQVEVPAGALTTTVDLHYRPRFVYEDQPAAAGRFMRFALEAVERGTGRAIHTFNRPVTLTVQMGDLYSGRPFYLLSQNRDSGAWDIAAGPLTPDPLTGLVRVPLEHFSNWMFGDVSKAGWKLSFSDAVVSQFSGSAAWSYPIEVMPGVHGLQPQVTLSYNSSRVGHSAAWIQSDWAGAGFSLDSLEITRNLSFGGLKTDDGGYDYLQACDHESDLCFVNDYTLLFNGSSYPLVSLGNGEYRTKSEQFLRIRQLSTGDYTLTDPFSFPTCPAAPGETTGQLEGGYSQPDGDWYQQSEVYACAYWEVTDQAGTVYRLGARADSEQRAGRVCIGYHSYSRDDNRHPCGGRYGYGVHGNPDDRLGPVVYRWRVDRVSDVYGNRLEYHYTEENAQDQYQAGNPDYCPWSSGYEHWCYNFRWDLEPYANGGKTWYYQFWDRASYLDWIGYNWRGGQDGFWGTRVVFDRACRSDSYGRAATGWCTATNRVLTGEDGPGDGLDDGMARHGNNLFTLWWQARYLRGIRVLQAIAPSSVVVVREYRFGYGASGDRTGPNEDGLPSRVLTSITPYGLNGYAGGAALPASTLSYTGYNTWGGGPNDCTGTTFPYGRLTAIENGYGARIDLAYAAAEGVWCNSRYYNWSVDHKTVSDGLAPALYSQYTYTKPCYKQEVTWAEDDGTVGCYATFDYPSSNHKWIMGYGQTLEQQYSGGTGGALLGTSRHTFDPEGADWTNGLTLSARQAALAGI